MGQRRSGSRLALMVLAAFLLLAACSGTPGQSLATLSPTPRPEITGQARLDQTLTAHPGTWGPGEVTLAYRWLRDGADIVGARETTYRLTRDDLGHHVSVRVAGSKPGYTDVDQESPQVGPVALAALTPSDPEIEGDAALGVTVSVKQPDWGENVSYAYQWVRGDAPIAGATERQYTIGVNDLTHKLSARVAATREGEQPVTRSTQPIGPIGRAAITITRAPTIVGASRYPSILTVAESGWGPDGVTLSYRWLRDGAPMTGEGVTGESYRIRGGDIGHRIAVRVTAKKPGHTTRTEESAAIGDITPGRLDPTPAPTIEGTAAVNRVLTASVQHWGPRTVTLSWQWFRGTTAIKDATSTRYRLVAADLGQAIKVRVTGRATYYATVRQYSKPTAKVKAGTLNPTPIPLYSGVAQVGRTITALPLTWGPGTVTLSYQWYRGGNTIKGANALTYSVVPADLGHRLRVKVTGKRAGFTTVAKTSGYTGTIAPGVLKPGKPKLTGAAMATATLTLQPGTWGPGTVALQYAWYRDNLRITKVTGTTYRLGGADVGHVIVVRVTGRRSGYATATVSTPPTERVQARER